MKKIILAALLVVLLASVLFMLQKQAQDSPITETTVRYNVPETVPEGDITVEPITAKYTDEEITSVFSDNICNLCTQTFGEYDVALQEPYEILENLGFKYFVPFDTDMETYVVKDNYLEFNIYLPDNRGRFTITKNNDIYKSVFRVLKDDEYATEPMWEDG